MDPLLLQQEMRHRQDHHAAMLSAQGFGPAPLVGVGVGGLPPHPSPHHYHHLGMPAMAPPAMAVMPSSAALARREEELARLHDAHNRIVEAEIAARSMRMAGAERFLDPASSYGAGAVPGPAAAGSPGLAGHPSHLAEEMAFRGHVQRRMLEEEAAKQHHQAMAAASAERQQAMMGLAQQMSDADLLRRAGEAQGGGAGGGVAASSERGSMEADPAARVSLGGENSAPASRQASLGSRQGTSPMQQQQRPTQQSGHSNPQAQGDAADPSKPLRYFNNGIEVDADGKPLPGGGRPGPAQARGENDAQAQAAAAAAAMVASSLASLDDNIIAKFLTVVVTRVPEVAPAIANLLPEGGDPAVLKREFPHVVDATLDELRSIQDKFAASGDAFRADLHQRVTNCIVAIEPYKAELGTAGAMMMPPPGPFPPGAMMPVALPPPVLPGMAPGPLRPGLPEPVHDPRVVPPLVSMPMHHAAALAAGVPPPHPPYFPGHPNDLALRQAHAFCPTGGMPADVAGAGAPLGMGHRPPHLIPPRDVVDPPKPGSPSEDMPMMAAHKMRKKEERTEARRLRRAQRKRKKKNRKPKLVHHAQFRGALDMDSTMRKAALARQREKMQARERGSNASEEAEEKEPTRREDKDDRGPPKEDFDDDRKPPPADEKRGLEEGGSDGKVGNPAKKRRAPDDAKIDDANNAIHSPALRRSPRKKAKDAAMGEGDNDKGLAAGSINDAKGSVGDSNGSVVTEESEDRAEGGRDEDGDGGHYDAANVLLGLMGK